MSLPVTDPPMSAVPVVCWIDRCGTTVRADARLGLCDAHFEWLREEADLAAPAVTRPRGTEAGAPWSSRTRR